MIDGPSGTDPAILIGFGLVFGFAILSTKWYLKHKKALRQQAQNKTK